MAVSCELRYIATACNRTPGCVSWGSNNLICFGACNSVAIYDPQKTKIIKTLSHHRARVNSVRWVQNEGLKASEFLSASSDKTCTVWSQKSSGSYSPSATLEGHGDAVTMIDGLYMPAEEGFSVYPPLIIATSSADCTVKVWRRNTDDNNVKNIQTIVLRNGLCLCLRLCLLPGALIPLLAVGADDAKIHLYSGVASEGGLKHVHSLAGHEDWVRCVDFALHDNGNILVASAGQDSLIRIWCLSQKDTVSKEVETVTDSNNELKLEEDIFSVEGSDRKYLWAATLDSVLAGHEGWVYEVCWHPRIFKDGIATQPLCLLSASLDKSMVLWSPGLGQDEDCVWLEQARVGEVGGNTLGFYGCQFSSDGLSILAHGYLGSFHLWHSMESFSNWKPGTTVGGHFGEVTDVGWEPDGEFLISVSLDQTTRLHAPWVNPSRDQVTWHELARPQVHGYDLQCLAVISRYKYASGAEEKIIRVFEAPSNFITNFHQICSVQEEHTDKLLTEAPCGASVPSLGLSNKAVYGNEIEPPVEERHPKDEYPESYFTPVTYTEPPKEEDLLQNTLWPEVQKLYGHGYELFSVSASHDGKILASACKATASQHAAIILWDTRTWEQYQQLESHELTVTQLSFSPNDAFLLSVSRDRRWSLFKRCENSLSFQILTTTDKKNGIHSRIIWCCAWTCDSNFFSTGSREGKIVVWGGNDSVRSNSQLGRWAAASTPLTLKESVTSLAFAPLKFREEQYLMAAGLEDGRIMFLQWSKSDGENWMPLLTVDRNLAHHLTVKRLTFHPCPLHTEGDSSVLLASAGADHAVKIYSISFNSK